MRWFRVNFKLLKYSGSHELGRRGFDFEKYNSSDAIKLHNIYSGGIVDPKGVVFPFFNPPFLFENFVYSYIVRRGTIDQ